MEVGAIRIRSGPDETTESNLERTPWLGGSSSTGAQEARSGRGWALIRPSGGDDGISLTDGDSLGPRAHPSDDMVRNPGNRQLGGVAECGPLHDLSTRTHHGSLEARDVDDKDVPQLSRYNGSTPAANEVPSAKGGDAPTNYFSKPILDLSGIDELMSAERYEAVKADLSCAMLHNMQRCQWTESECIAHFCRKTPIAFAKPPVTYR